MSLPPQQQPQPPPGVAVYVAQAPQMPPGQPQQIYMAPPGMPPRPPAYAAAPVMIRTGVGPPPPQQRPQMLSPATAMPTPGGGKRGSASMAGPPMMKAGGPQAVTTTAIPSAAKKKRRIGDKTLPPQIRELVPESQAYMDLLAFERKLDATISRKRLDIQEALKRPMKQKRKLRIFLTNMFNPGKDPGEDGQGGQAPSWELKVEGRMLDDPALTAATTGAAAAATTTERPSSTLQKRKFSSFFKSLVIELDKDIYGPDNHLVEWHRTPQTSETDGFQVKRPGNQSVKCTILFQLDYQPMKFKLDPRLARLLGIHCETRPKIIEALWQYIKTHKLQDANERDHINCDRYLEQIFQTTRMRFMEIPSRLHQLLHPPDPVLINHMINVDQLETKKATCYDVEVEVDDPVKQQMHEFLVSQQNQAEISALDQKIYDTVEQINQLKTQREFYLAFSQDPQQFIGKWIASQCNDLKTMTDNMSQPELERRADFYQQPWIDEAIQRYISNKLKERRGELEQQHLNIRNN